ncbi:unnamed protein product (macronuclear) [Paramecium tetraurelia]|uniref:Uncharacterized protein n=1 Tax=Paramecium tetraurelia TaxID=5888 RepID=A0CZF8_PARTE|nr:uncharacterized protein GSPATT00011748001 [Paramecium tetraurelia]CAK76175.1 unnamed protein product [Paramecium tetraurelia]|eukprot:XP_001443572.1 hypothetical protein (macronuclear) [Paramecium tetraurelia strain d4-2]
MIVQREQNYSQLVEAGLQTEEFGLELDNDLTIFSEKISQYSVRRCCSTDDLFIILYIKGQIAYIFNEAIQRLQMIYPISDKLIDYPKRQWIFRNIQQQNIQNGNIQLEVTTIVIGMSFGREKEQEEASKIRIAKSRVNGQNYTKIIVSKQALLVFSLLESMRMERGNWLTLFDGKILQLNLIQFNCNGLYDEYGLKTGNWVELNSNFSMFHILQFSFNQLQQTMVKRRILKRTKNKLMGCNLKLLKISNWMLQCNAKGLKQGSWNDLSEKFIQYYIFAYPVIRNFTKRENTKMEGEQGNDRSQQMIKQLVKHSMTKMGQYKVSKQSCSKIQQGIYKYVLGFREIGFMQEGEYLNGKRVGQWFIVLDEKKFGGGFYDADGLKIGKWVEILKKMNQIPSFTQQSGIIVKFEGEYFKGKRVGNWKLKQNQKAMYKMRNLTISGSGTFNENGDKKGRFIELHKQEDFSEQIYKQFQNQIQVNFKCNRIQKWSNNTIIRNSIMGKMMQRVCSYKSAGGFYDLDNHKTGKWIELGERSDGVSDVKYIGYYINAKKVEDGRFNMIIVQGKRDLEFKIEEAGLMMKRTRKMVYGMNFILTSKVIKQFKLEITNMKLKLENGKQNKMAIQCIKTIYISGSGQIDENGLKNSEWIDLHMDYSEFTKIFNIEQYQSGQQMGINQRIHNRNVMQQSMDNQQAIKLEWIETWKMDGITRVLHPILVDNIQWRLQQWQQNWKMGTVFKNKLCRFFDLSKSSGGFYDDNGLKVGFWIDLCQNFINVRQVTFAGKYNHGNRIGKWDLIFKDNIIGSGEYLEFDTKQGDWIELESSFQDYKLKLIVNQWQITFGIREIRRWQQNWKMDYSERLSKIVMRLINSIQS